MMGCSLLFLFSISQWIFHLEGFPPLRRREDVALTSPYAVKFAGKGIPYVENFDEQTVRKLWEIKPFSCANSVVNVALTSTSNAKLLKVAKLETKGTSTEFEGLFDGLYTSGTMFDPLPLQYRSEENGGNNFLLRLAYRGTDFCGWQTQLSNTYLPSVQKSVETWLEELEGRRVDVRVCGRTDAGVHAIGQVARFRTRRKELSEAEIFDHLSKIPTTKSLRCVQVLPVSKSFHPSFCAQSRAYVYLIDVDQWDAFCPAILDVADQQLQKLQGLPLDYHGLSYGRVKTQTTVCTLYHARARLVENPISGKNAICIELVGDRFLRRMVRILVSTCLRIAVRPQPSPDALLQHIKTRDRMISGNAAPSEGLIFVGATFR